MVDSNLNFFSKTELLSKPNMLEQVFRVGNFEKREKRERRERKRETERDRHKQQGFKICHYSEP